MNRADLLAGDDVPRFSASAAAPDAPEPELEPIDAPIDADALMRENPAYAFAVRPPAPPSPPSFAPLLN